MSATTDTFDKPIGTTAPLSLKSRLLMLTEKLVQPVDGASLAGFRILFGLIMVYETYRYFAFDRIARYYVEPQFYFTYELFPWVRPWPEPWIYVHFIILGVASLGLMLGLFYRLSAYIFLLTYSYIFLMDKAQHNNHYYLIILLGFLLLFVDGQRVASLDNWRRRGSRWPDGHLVPFWNVFILRAQIFIVYFYAGIAKLNGDWLALEPMRSWLHNRADYPLVGQFFTTEVGAIFFAYGGLIFDLSIGFLLLWRRTRLLGFVGLLFFHLMNKWLFSIGVFPYMMIATTILFVDPSWPRRFLRLPVPQISSNSWLERTKPYRPAVAAFVGLYLLIQVLVPFRHWLYPGEVSWNEEGHRFSWHMKLRSKQAGLTFYVTDPATNEVWQIDASQVVSDRQYGKMATRPDMILQFAHYMRDQFQATGEIENPIIQVEAWASLNGRPFQRFIDHTVDLAQQPAPRIFGHYDWVLPLTHDIHGQAISQTVSE
ncbi:MAG: HTTM domain-containing protein [Anaerolineae bacterium]|nr:HTTM domain-containing protein [Anaerolineae bacterium]